MRHSVREVLGRDCGAWAVDCGLWTVVLHLYLSGEADKSREIDAVPRRFGSRSNNDDELRWELGMMGPSELARWLKSSPGIRAANNGHDKKGS